MKAREQWRWSIDSKTADKVSVRGCWADGSRPTVTAAEYAFAGDATRSQIDAREEEARKRELKRLATEAEQEQIEKREAAAKAETIAAEAKTRAAEAERQRFESERQRMVEVAEAERRRLADGLKRTEEEAEREKKRRFAPESTVFSLKLISVSHHDSVTSIAAGTELKVTKKNPDGTLHVEKDDLATDVLPIDVTNYRDLAASIRSNDKAAQEAIRQWQAEQVAAAAAIQREKYSQPTPSPSIFKRQWQPKGTALDRPERR